MQGKVAFRRREGPTILNKHTNNRASGVIKGKGITMAEGQKGQTLPTTRRLLIMVAMASTETPTQASKG